MTKKEITDIKIECRNGSGHPIWNIMMFAEPGTSEDGFSYADLVTMAEGVLRGAKGLKAGEGWFVSSAEVMAWSGSKRTNLEHRGPTHPHRFRVTLDMENYANYKEDDDAPVPVDLD